MGNVKHFNSGRLYNKHGQQISFVVVDNILYVHDHSRMICGEVDLGDIPTTPVTLREVMWLYDNGKLKQSSRATDMAFQRDGILSKFDPSGNNDINQRL